MEKLEIVEILKVVLALEYILCELHFNLRSLEANTSFSLIISNDGDTILFEKREGWITPNDLHYEDPYQVTSITGSMEDEELAKLVGNKIENMKFGIGETFDTKQPVLYYFLMTTDKHRFLFFNNGDDGGYSFDKIDDILAGDIFGYRWSDVLKLDRFS